MKGRAGYWMVFIINKNAAHIPITENWKLQESKMTISVPILSMSKG